MFPYILIPADKTAYLQFGDGFKNDVSVKISDVFGRVVYNKILTNVSNSKVILDVSNYAAGVYQINVNDKNSREILQNNKKIDQIRYRAPIGN